jgi:hypothetical protein
MTSPDLDSLLHASLGRPMTDRQRSRLDATLAARLSPVARRPRGRAVALLVAAMLISAPIVVAVSGAMRTTEAPNGMEAAAAFQAEIDAAKAAVPIPDGYAWPDSLQASDPEGLYSTGGGRSQVEFVAVCAWSTAWLAADSAGSTADATSAATVLAGVPDWQVYKGEFSSGSLRDVLDSVVAGVKGGDRQPVSAFTTANCGG